MPVRRTTLSFSRLSPNILTVLALCAGLTAMRFALEGRFEAAVATIVAAGALDASDGRLARLLRASSRFGAELDSLSDVIAFGVAPAVVLWQWTMHGMNGIGWSICLLHAVCVALRLARFNTRLDEPAPPWAGRFFTGLSAPAGAGLTLVPMMLSFQGDGFGIFRNPILNGVVMVTIGMLMVSRVPTYSFKSVRLPPSRVLPLLLGIGVVVGLLVGAPWSTLAGIGIVYAATIPFSLRAWRHAAVVGEEGTGATAR